MVLGAIRCGALVLSSNSTSVTPKWHLSMDSLVSCFSDAFENSSDVPYQLRHRIGSYSNVIYVLRFRFVLLVLQRIGLWL